MKVLTILFLALCSFSVNAQIIDGHQSTLFNGENRFNATFIKTNKIKIITGKISLKRDMQPIVREGTIIQYRFNPAGNIEERLKSFRMRGGHIDTTAEYFSYNDLSKLIAQTTYNVSGYDAIRFEYNSEAQPIKEIYVRGENTSSYSYQLQKGKESVLKTESFSYSKNSDSSWTKTYLNSAGKAYKTVTTITNALGQKKSETTRYKLTNKKQSVTYMYNVKGLLEKVINYSNLMGVETTTYTYQYDEFDNLNSSKIYKNGKHIETKEYLYNVQTFLLKAELTKDESTKSIRIIQFEYEFY